MAPGRHKAFIGCRDRRREALLDLQREKELCVVVGWGGGGARNGQHTEPWPRGTGAKALVRWTPQKTAHHDGPGGVTMLLKWLQRLVQRLVHNHPG